MGTYSFLDTQCTLYDAVTGQFINIGAGAAVSEEGIEVEQTEDVNNMKAGLDFTGVHSLHGNKNAHIMVRLLKTSPINALLQNLLQQNRTSGGKWGQMTIRASNAPLGDNITAQQTAFAKVPKITYAKDAGMNEWRFDSIVCDVLLGGGG
jgi:hypothetical protein